MTRRRRRTIAALGTCAVLLGALAAPPVSTDAAFTDTEAVSSGPFGTVVLVAPEITRIVSCSRPSGTNAYLVVEWRWPSGRPYDDLARTGTVWTVEGSTQTPSTVSLGEGAYRSTFTANSGLLTLLASLLLGGNVDVETWTTWTAPGSSEPWRSAGVDRVAMRIGGALEGFATSCTLP